MHASRSSQSTPANPCRSSVPECAPAASFVLHFSSLIHAGREFAFPCDEQGVVTTIYMRVPCSVENSPRPVSAACLPDIPSGAAHRLGDRTRRTHPAPPAAEIRRDRSSNDCTGLDALAVGWRFRRPAFLRPHCSLGRLRSRLILLLPQARNWMGDGTAPNDRRIAGPDRRLWTSRVISLVPRKTSWMRPFRLRAHARHGASLRAGGCADCRVLVFELMLSRDAATHLERIRSAGEGRR
jgi:hypothetical protein